MGQLEFFMEIDLTDGGKKIVRAVKLSDLSDWAAHGSDFSIPFADSPKDAHVFVVSHVGTKRRLPIVWINKLPFDEAVRLAAWMDDRVDGMSQVEHRDGFEVVGWSLSIQRQMAKAIYEFHLNSRYAVLNKRGLEYFSDFLAKDGVYDRA